MDECVTCSAPVNAGDECPYARHPAHALAVALGARWEGAQTPDVDVAMILALRAAMRAIDGLDTEAQRCAVEWLQHLYLSDDASAAERGGP